MAMKMKGKLPLQFFYSLIQSLVLKVEIDNCPSLASDFHWRFCRDDNHIAFQLPLSSKLQTMLDKTSLCLHSACNEIMKTKKNVARLPAWIFLGDLVPSVRLNSILKVRL